MSARAPSCPVCAKPLQEVEVVNGSVWACGSHGVKRWFFDDARSDVLRFAASAPGAERAHP